MIPPVKPSTVKQMEGQTNERTDRRTERKTDIRSGEQTLTLRTYKFFLRSSLPFIPTRTANTYHRHTTHSQTCIHTHIHTYIHAYIHIPHPSHDQLLCLPLFFQYRQRVHPFLLVLSFDVRPLAPSCSVAVFAVVSTKSIRKYPAEKRDSAILLRSRSAITRRSCTSLSAMA